MGALSGILNAGSLDRRIAIHTPTETKDDSGAPLNSFAKLAETWAKVDYTSSNESEILSKETAVTKVTFTIRHREDLDTKLKIVYNNEFYNILGIKEIDQVTRYQEILTELAK